LPPPPPKKKVPTIGTLTLCYQKSRNHLKVENRIIFTGLKADDKN